ncbi:hypothetical protein BDV18DRAFT_163864 [Aspergillus unguis]
MNSINQPGVQAPGQRPDPAPTLLQQIAHTILTNAQTPYNNLTLLFYIFGFLDNQELIQIMDADARFVPLVYWEYGAMHAWAGGVNMLDDGASLQLWHLFRAKRLIRVEQEEVVHGRLDEIKVRGLATVSDTDAARWIFHTQRLRRIREEEGNEKYSWFYHMRRSITRLQQRQAEIAAMNGIKPTPKQQVLLEYTARTPASLSSAMRNCKADIANIQKSIRSDEPPTALPLPAVPLPPLVPPAQAILFDTLLANISGMAFPAETIIEYDADRALRMLARLGYFNPLGYNHMGYSWLHHAIDARSPKCTSFLLSAYNGNPSLLLQSTGLTNAVQTPLARNIPAMLVHSAWVPLFTKVWNEIVAADPSVNANRLFDAFERDLLCQQIDGPMAESLARQGLDLAQHTNVQSTTPWTALGTVWHLAIINTKNTSFLEYLGARTPGTINIPNQSVVPVTPISVAARLLQNMPAVQVLVKYGAHTYGVAQPLLHDLVDPEDATLSLYMNGPGTRLDTDLWIHAVLVGLENHIADNPAEPAARDRLIRRAKKLITALKRGRGGVRASLTVTDTNGDTPVQFARRNRLSCLSYMLEPREEPTNGRGDGTRYGLRKRERVNYPESGPEKRRRKR